MSEDYFLHHPCYLATHFCSSYLIIYQFFLKKTKEENKFPPLHYYCITEFLKNKKITKKVDKFIKNLVKMLIFLHKKYNANEKRYKLMISSE